jgi:hypothetical protein
MLESKVWSSISAPVNVPCPLCSGTAIETFDPAGIVCYHCVGCGFYANSDIADDSNRLISLPKGLRKLVKRARFTKECWAVFAGRRTIWWPRGFQAYKQIDITPIVADEKPLWRCYQPDGTSSDYETFTEAIKAPSTTRDRKNSHPKPSNTTK